MNKKAIIFLGSILVLIIITVVFIIFVARRNTTSTNQNQLTSSGSDFTGSSAGSSSGSSSSGSSSGTSSSGNSSSGSATGPGTTTGTGTGSGSAAGSGSSSGNAGGSNGSGSGSSQLLRVTDTAAVGPVLSYDGTLLWYFTSDGHLYKINLTTGAKQEYVLPTNYKVTNVIWPSVGNNFIIESDSNSGRTFYYYNSASNSYVTYPASVKEVDFAQDGSHVFYEWLDSSGKATLSSGNFDLTGHKTLVNLPDSDDIIKVAPTRNRAFYYKASALSDGKIYYVNLANPASTFSIKTAATNQVIWAPDGDHFLYNKLDKDGNASSTQLWLGSLDANKDAALGVNGQPVKAAFDRIGANLFLAQSQPGLSGDSFMMVDLKTLSSRQIQTGSTIPISAANLTVTNDDKNLYFLNLSDSYVYGLPIN